MDEFDRLVLIDLIDSYALASYVAATQKHLILDDQRSIDARNAVKAALDRIINREKA